MSFYRLFIKEGKLLFPLKERKKHAQPWRLYHCIATLLEKVQKTHAIEFEEIRVIRKEYSGTEKKDHNSQKSAALTQKAHAMVATSVLWI